MTQPITCADFLSSLRRITARPLTLSVPCTTQPITRIQAARLISASLPPMNLGIAGGLIPSFSDIQPLTYDQKDAVRVVYAAAIMFGTSPSTFEPNRALTTTEAGLIFTRMRQRLHAQRPSLPFDIIRDPANVPPQVARTATATKTRPGGYVVQEPNATYVVISAGEYPTGGYSIDVRSVQQVGNRIEIDVELQTPAPDMMVIQVLTYPQTILKLTKTDLPIEII